MPESSANTKNNDETKKNGNSKEKLVDNDT